MLCTIGFGRGQARKYAQVLVLDHQLDSAIKFNLVVRNEIARYSAILQLDTVSTHLLEDHFNRMSLSTSVPPSPSSSTGGA